MIILAAGALLLTARSLESQQVFGRLLRSGTDEPLAGALVILVDSMGQEAARSISTGSGGFALPAPGPGSFRIRVLRIGARPWTTQPLELGRNERRELRLTLEDNPVLLPEIEIRAAVSRCGVRPGDADVMGRLLNEAEKALAIAAETVREGRLLFRTESWARRPSPDGAPGERESRSTFGLARWPVNSAPPESLAIWGFAHMGPPYGTPEELVVDRGLVYYGPDARVLFSEWFLQGHCFTVAVDSADSARPGILVHFTPVRSRRGVDISGTIRLHRETLQLRSLSFRYTGLGRWMPPDSAGGELSFRKLRTGAMIIDRWSMRAPIPIMRAGREPGFFGFAENGGRVIEVLYDGTGEPERLSLISSLRGGNL